MNLETNRCFFCGEPADTPIDTGGVICEDCISNSSAPPNISDIQDMPDPNEYGSYEEWYEAQAKQEEAKK